VKSCIKIKLHTIFHILKIIQFYNNCFQNHIYTVFEQINCIKIYWQSTNTKIEHMHMTPYSTCFMLYNIKQDASHAKIYFGQTLFLYIERENWFTSYQCWNLRN